MNILHITDELTKKNYSISSLIFYLTEYIENKNQIRHNILSTYLERDTFNDKNNIILIKTNSFLNCYKNVSNIKDIIKNHEYVHIHGIWRWIHFISIFHCARLSIPFFIHPHGMLLNAALKNKGFFNYFMKKILLKLYSFFLRKRINFISITKQESESINFFFKNTSIHLIQNPVPFLINQDPIKIEKVFIFFGRLHPIKNLELMIEAFTEANLGDDWKLDIYGIKDDKKYHKKLILMIEGRKNIFIKKPVFGLEKQKIISSSWANILLSKSEVLSLSVLESASLELPSLVNEDIAIDEFTKNEGVVTTTEIKSISKNIKEISNWSLKLRIKKGKKLKEFINLNYSIESLYKKYYYLYDNKR